VPNSFTSSLISLLAWQCFLLSSVRRSPVPLDSLQDKHKIWNPSGGHCPEASGTCHTSRHLGRTASRGVLSRRHVPPSRSRRTASRRSRSPAPLGQRAGGLRCSRLHSGVSTVSGRSTYGHPLRGISPRRGPRRGRVPPRQWASRAGRRCAVPSRSFGIPGCTLPHPACRPPLGSADVRAVTIACAADSGLHAGHTSPGHLGDKMPDISLDQMLAGTSRGCWLLSTDGSATNWHAAELDED